MKIRSWNIAINNHPKWRLGTVLVVEQPLWLAVLEWFIDYVLGYGCYVFHWIKLPSFLKLTDEGHEYTWREYYGDVGDLYHLYVFGPIFQWYYRRPGRKEYCVEIGYDKLKDIFGERFARFFADQENLN